MKRYFFRHLMVAGLGLLTAPAFAQQDKDKKDVQQIIINRSGDKDEKTVIEIKGDKVTINGKDAKDSKDVNVRINKVRDVHAFRPPNPPRAGGLSLNFDHDGDVLFNVDSNRAMLGIITEPNEQGAEISSVSKESAAEKAGLKEGDIITKIDNKKIESTSDVAEEVRKHKPGEKVTISVLRDGKEQKITAELGRFKGVNMNAKSFRISPDMLEGFRNYPHAPDAPMPFEFRGFPGSGSPRLGLSVQDTEDGKGVKVVNVDEDSNAAKAGVKEDDVITHVNDKAVNSADEIARLVKENKDKSSVMLKLLRKGKVQNVEVRIPKKLKTANL